mmetsp:Transcript_13112/g.30885  ORF Transcript_13112/g.30885 Transcript_13112/m.30885 type:complete len:93 (-) Transcript_13112:114-392(-)
MSQKVLVFCRVQMISKTESQFSSARREPARREVWLLIELSFATAFNDTAAGSRERTMLMSKIFIVVVSLCNLFLSYVLSNIKVPEKFEVVGG